MAARFIYTAVANTNDYVIDSNSNTWTLSRAGTGNIGASPTTDTSLNTGSWLAGGTTWHCNQQYFEFDTSSFPASGTVNLVLYVITANGGPLEARQSSWSGSGTGNFVAGASLSGLTQVGGTIDLGAVTSVYDITTGFQVSASFKFLLHGEYQRTQTTTPSTPATTFGQIASSNSTTNPVPRIELTVTTNAVEKVITATGAGNITVGGGGGNDPPSGVTLIMVETWGAGGSSATATGAKPGGASGAYSRKLIPVVNGDILYYQNYAGQAYNGAQPTKTWVRKNTNSGPTNADVVADSANNQTAGSIANCVGDVKIPGAAGTAAQGGGGSRGGSGGSSSACPTNATAASGTTGTASTPGLGNANADTDSGDGGDGGAGAGGTGSPGVQPGGGAGGGGSSSGSSGTGGAGQIRFSWIPPGTAMPPLAPGRPFHPFLAR